ncbi:MAG: DUF4926 domain-containing protein [Limnothrix sp. RL_2_0]|nr:DUF4926 domain-containing protein [Limnothrix sp. RL_2_0]
MKQIKDLDIVAITEDIQTNHYGTGESITLYKGQVGTVVMEFDGTAFEVEFSGNNGSTYAMETVPAEKLLLLYYELVAVAA